jgi:hypothetical protein
VKALTGILASAGLVLALTGCSNIFPNAQPTTSLDATDYQITHFSVDPPKPTDIVLRISADSFSHFTMGQLDQVSTLNQTLFERFIDKRATFRGVPLSKVFELAGIKPSNRVVFFASDDYRYSDTAKNMIRSRGLLAVEMNGKPISADQGGPIRIVFPDKTPYSEVSEPWVWSITRISKVK